jgi:hypothetical protein
MYLNVAPFLWSCYEAAPAGSSRTACIALPLCSRAANGPGPQIIGRTSDEVDVLSTNDWQLLLCQITRGCNCRGVCWGCVPGQGSPATFRRPSSRIRRHGSTWSRSVFAGVMVARLRVRRCERLKWRACSPHSNVTPNSQSRGQYQRAPLAGVALEQRGMT